MSWKIATELGHHGQVEHAGRIYWCWSAKRHAGKPASILLPRTSRDHLTIELADGRQLVLDAIPHDLLKLPAPKSEPGTFMPPRATDRSTRGFRQGYHKAGPDHRTRPQAPSAVAAGLTRFDATDLAGANPHREGRAAQCSQVPGQPAPDRAYCPGASVSPFSVEERKHLRGIRHRLCVKLIQTAIVAGGKVRA